MLKWNKSSNESLSDELVTVVSCEQRCVAPTEPCAVSLLAIGGGVFGRRLAGDSPSADHGLGGLHPRAALAAARLPQTVPRRPGLAVPQAALGVQEGPLAQKSRRNHGGAKGICLVLVMCG